MKAIFRDTLSELLSRKVLFLFGCVTLVMLLAVYLTGEIESDLSRSSGGNFQVEELIGPLAPWIAEVFSKVMSVLIFLAVLASVGLIPKALEKGRAEFYLARPISRTGFLFSKLLSIWVIYGSVAIMCGLITYAVAAVIHRMFDMSILILFFIYLLNFLVWLSVVIFAGVISGSTVWAMTAVFVVWLAQWLLSFHEGIRQLVSSELVTNLVATLYYIVPKTGEMGDLAVRLAIGRSVESWMPLWSSLLFAFAILYLALVVFKRNNY
jgi:ABC-type transport system involved in multi-copper enzyme maturation permease subunit